MFNNITLIRFATNTNNTETTADYVVATQTKADYNKACKGELFTPVTYYIVKAETSEDAVKIIKQNFPALCVCEKTWLYSDIIAEAKYAQEIIKKEQDKKQKKAEKEKAKATKMGLTLDEYKKYTLAVNNVKNNEREIKKAKEEIEKLKKEIENRQRAIVRYKKQIEKYTN